MPEFQGPGPRPGWSPPPLKLSADAPFIGPVGPMVSGSQENLDLGIEGWHRGTSLLAQGLVPLMIVAAAQFNPQQVQAQIFKPQPAAPVVTTALGTFVSGSQQRYVDSISQVFASVTAGGTPTAPEWVYGSPQFDPSQLAAFVFESQPAAPAAASPVTRFFSALPVEASQPASQIWRAAITPPAPGLISKFLQAAPELIDLGIEGWHRGPSLSGGVVGISGDFVKPVFASPQLPPYISSVTWASVVSPQGPGGASEFRFGNHAVAVYAAEARKSRLFSIGAAVQPASGDLGTFVRGAPQLKDWTLQAQIIPSAITQPVQGAVPPTIRGAPQLLDLTQQGWILGTTPFGSAPLVQGAVPPLVLAGQPQESTQQIGAVVFTPLEVGVPPVPGPSVDYQYRGDGKKHTKKWKKTNELLDDIEQTLHELVYGAEPNIEGAIPDATISTVKIRLAEGERAVVGYDDLAARLAVIRAELFALIESKQREIDDDDNDFFMLS